MSVGSVINLENLLLSEKRDLTDVTVLSVYEHNAVPLSGFRMTNLSVSVFKISIFLRPNLNFFIF